MQGYSIQKLNRVGGDTSEARKIAALLISLGRHSCHRHNPDGMQLAMEALTTLTVYCNDSPRYWRETADIFNEKIKELYFYSEEWLGGSTHG